MQNGKLLSFLPAQIAHQMHIKNRLLLYASLCIVADCYAMNVCWSLHLWDLGRKRERQHSVLETMMHHETLRKKLIQGLQTETIIENPAHCGFGTCRDFAEYLGYVYPADQKLKNKIARHNEKMYKKREEEFLQKFFAGYDTH